LVVNIPASQVGYRRKIGRTGNRAVFGIGTIGGLHLVVAASRSGGGFETLGAGSHPGVARHIAKTHCDDIEFDDIAKSGQWGPELFQDFVPAAELLTKQIREAQGF
jgi:hypothetical protein